MTVEHLPVRFQCCGDWLYGIASVPLQRRRRGVIVVVGGPQYRAGSHRQFTLLARELAERGTPVLRFDYRGMGDSQGEPRQFDSVDQDLRAAIDHFTGAGLGVSEVVLWGLCDGATAALLYAAQDARVTGLALVNPWARSVDGIAKTTLKHYYRRRILDRRFWKKIWSGRFNPAVAAASLVRLFGNALRCDAGPKASRRDSSGGGAPLRERMHAGLDRFKGRVLLLTSGKDLTALEFLEMEKSSARWKAVLARPQVNRYSMADADHTFSRRPWSAEAARVTADWLESW